MPVHPVLVDEFPAPPGPADWLACLPPDAPGRFLLESAGGPPDLARWTLFGHAPFRVLSGCPADPFAALDELLATGRVEPVPGLPPFCGGAVGCLSYDLARRIERLPETATADLDLPDLHLGLYDHLAAVDHARGRIMVLAVPLPGREQAALAGAQGLAAAVRRTLARGPRPLPPAAAPAPGAARLPQSQFDQAGYCRAVERVRAYIAAGDAFVVNLAQRFRCRAPAPAEELYRRLRAINPAPFAAFLDCGRFQLVSASPERFLQVDAGGRVESRPIKGTRPRRPDPRADRAQAMELWASAKEQAELTMVVDLVRNDLGRVCAYGSVHVPTLRRLEAYPSVWHTAATVAGRLRPGTTPGRLLRAAFPGGSVTGAPKVRVMEIIEELEGVRRGFYCGALGYFSFTGHADLAMTIRTLCVAGETVTLHAGGGIVYDSDPAAEYHETLQKAAALLQALGVSAWPQSG